MHFASGASFSLIEWLSISGFVQNLVMLVYIVFRARSFKQAAISLSYFFFLTAAFALQFALRLDDFTNPIRQMLWFSRSMGPPLCYLMVLQVARLAEMPEKKNFLILLLVPAAYVLAAFGRRWLDVCAGASGAICDRFFDMLYWGGSMGGVICMAAFFLHPHLFGAMRKLKGGRERYWLVMTLIAANLLVVVVQLLRAGDELADVDTDLLLNLFGIVFSYLVTTTLFRVYPLPVPLNAKSRTDMLLLSEHDKKAAKDIERLMNVDKLYHEQKFSRAMLAKEMGISESNLSRILNAVFGKSFPRLVSEYRVEDAKRMLHDPAIPVKVLAFEVGFSSLASFNRVFREVTGQTPSLYRQQHLEQFLNHFEKDDAH